MELLSSSQWLSRISNDDSGSFPPDLLPASFLQDGHWSCKPHLHVRTARKKQGNSSWDCVFLKSKQKPWDRLLQMWQGLELDCMMTLQ